LLPFRSEAVLAGLHRNTAQHSIIRKYFSLKKICMKIATHMTLIFAQSGDLCIDFRCLILKRKILDPE